MSTSASIVYKTTANRVNFDGYPEFMLKRLRGRTEESVEDLVNGPEIRILGDSPEEDELYRVDAFAIAPNPMRLRGDTDRIACEARKVHGSDYVYIWTKEGWMVA